MARRTYKSLGIPSDCDPRIRDFVRYWLSVGPNDKLPGRQHIDPAGILGLLPNVWLIDVVSDPLRFRFRLVGTGLIEYCGHDPTGKWIDEAFPHFPQSATFQDLASVVRDHKENWRRGSAILRYQKNFKRLERVFLPLARDGEEVDMIFCMTLFLGNNE